MVYKKDTLNNQCERKRGAGFFSVKRTTVIPHNVDIENVGAFTKLPSIKY